MQSPGKTLKELVQHFRNNHLKRLRAELEAFQDMSLDEIIEFAARAKQSSGFRHLHHTWKNEDPLDNAHKRLTQCAQEIDQCKSFAELLTLVEKITSEIVGLGALYNYDCALSLGAKKGTMPEVVYLHAGSREGAKALGLAWRKSMISVPKQLKSLTPDEVEDFLCIYKAWLKPAMIQN